jgi:hypothetical protein
MLHNVIAQLRDVEAIGAGVDFAQDFAQHLFAEGNEVVLFYFTVSRQSHT